MTVHTQPTDVVADRKTADVPQCDLCGHSDEQQLAPPSPARCRIVMCRNCGLFYASPSLSPDLLDKFYDEEFEGDAGTNRRLKDGAIEARKVAKEDSIANEWAMPLITDKVDPKDKRVLDVRCRSGSLAEALSKAGATVTAVDPLEPNAQHAKERGTIADVRFVPIEKFERLEMFDGERFDIITALSIHLLSHSPSPRKLLHRLGELLNPGGYLFLDEKDVFHPVRAAGETVFDTGPAHFFHFTTDTMRKYFEAEGFDVVECRIDPDRKKSSRHIRSVVRKPVTANEAMLAGAVSPCDPEKVILQLEQAERKLRMKSGFNTFMKGARRTVRKVWN